MRESERARERESERASERERERECVCVFVCVCLCVCVCVCVYVCMVWCEKARTTAAHGESARTPTYKTHIVHAHIQAQGATCSLARNLCAGASLVRTSSYLTARSCVQCASVGERVGRGGGGVCVCVEEEEQEKEEFITSGNWRWGGGSGGGGGEKLDTGAPHLLSRP